MDKLLVETYHQIFDHLDIETIFFSIRPVCRSFQRIVQNYDRFDFNLKIISKTRFDVLCRYISPSNIRSLTLYNNDLIDHQMKLFPSQVRLRQLTRLHSIHLYGIEEFQFNSLFKQINVNLLRSFSVLMAHDNRGRKTTSKHLSKIVQQSTLRQIDFGIQDDRIFEIEWPMNWNHSSY